MAENAGVRDHLTPAMIEAGAELTRKLDETGMAPSIALWLFVPEINEWRLVFATPEVTAQGPGEVYERIRLALEALGKKASAVRFSAIGLLYPGDELVERLETAMRTGPHLDRKRLSKTAINGLFIDDALIYRVA